MMILNASKNMYVVCKLASRKNNIEYSEISQSTQIYNRINALLFELIITFINYYLITYLSVYYI